MKRFLDFSCSGAALLVLGGSLLFPSCSGTVEPASPELITFKYDAKRLDSLPGFLKKVKSIEVIPLESVPEAVISGSYGSNLMITDDEFFIYESLDHSKLCRFSKDGRFLNRIGQRGRGPEEYINLRGAQLLGDTVLAYSATGETTLLYYKKEGEFIGSEKLEITSSDLRKIGDDLLLARGYGSTDPTNRAILKSHGGDKLFFPTTAVVPGMGEVAPMLESYNAGKEGRLTDYLYRETFNDTIYLYNVAAKRFYPHVAFDFGELAPSKSFFEQTESDRAMQILFEKYDKGGFMANARYLENDKIRLGEFSHNQVSGNRFIYFFDDKEGAEGGKGEWFVLVAGEKNFSECIKQIYNGKIYCLISPSRFLNMLDLLKDKIANYQEFTDLKEDSNCLILVLEMV